MKIIKILIVLLLPLCLFVDTNADNNAYVVKDNNSGLNEKFDYYNQAYNFYNENLDNYDNLTFYENNKLIFMEYGIVEFNNIVTPIEYYSVSKNCKDYISALYGIDAAYLYTQNNNVYFLISGDIGYTSIDNIVLHPIEEVNVGLSLYQTKDGYLYHNIKNQLEYDFYQTSLCIDYLPSFLTDNNKYFSYDGHYFYDDFKLMIDDYRSQEHLNASNESPYYNYYQYLPHRSLTNYSCEELENYFYSTLGMDNRLNKYVDLNNDYAADEINRSQLYGNINEFFNNQYLYGTNALMLISSAVNESSYGRNLNSYLNNNLYLNAAYESSQEKNNDRFDSIANSIYSHSKYYISKLYSNYLSSKYFGTYFGNKVGGINVEYSLDQYYGEKAASEYFKIDKALGKKDYNSHGLAIINDLNCLNIYNDSNLTDKKISINNIRELSFVILEVYDLSYKIQLDSSFNSEYLYDFNNSVGYINKDDVDYVVNGDSIGEYELNRINFDFNGGNYHDYNSISILTNTTYNPYDMLPSNPSYEFVDYENIVDEKGSIIYKANYKKIDDIETHISVNNVNLYPYYDLTKDKIIVKFEDGSKKVVNVNTDNISLYDTNCVDNQIISINYNGISKQEEIKFDHSFYDEYNAFSSAIATNDIDYIKENIDKLSFGLDMPQIRNFDHMLSNTNKRNYVIQKNPMNYDISLSGLDLSLDDRKNFNLIEDTYYVIVDDVNALEKERVENIAKSYGFDIEGSLNLKFKFNYQNLDLRGPVVVQLDLSNKTNDNIYSVYHLCSNGDIQKVRTSQSNKYIQFIIYETGDYILLSMPSMNKYEINDFVENLSYANAGIDNNQINIEFMLGLLLIVLALVGILIYYRYTFKKDKQWKDYKKSLLKADTVQEEKQKN